MRRTNKNDSAEYAAAIAQARANLADLKKRGDAAIGANALELMQSYMTPEEIAASDRRVAKMIERTRAMQHETV